MKNRDFGTLKAKKYSFALLPGRLYARGTSGGVLGLMQVFVQNIDFDVLHPSNEPLPMRRDD